MASAAGVAGVRATLDLGSKSSKCVQCGEPDSARITRHLEVEQGGHVDGKRPSHRSVETGCAWMVSYPEVIRKMREVAMSDSGARGPWCSRCASRRVRHFPATAVSGTMSKPNETPRKYQNGPSSCAATASGEDGDSTGVPRLCSSVLDGHTVVLAVPPIPPISLAGWGF